MTPTDRNNLNFIISASPEELRQWYAELSPDEYQYALPLLDMAQTTISMLINLQHVETQLESLNGDYALALAALRVIM